MLATEAQRRIVDTKIGQRLARPGRTAKLVAFRAGQSGTSSPINQGMAADLDPRPAAGTVSYGSEKVIFMNGTSGAFERYRSEPTQGDSTETVLFSYICRKKM